jgi:hypothetical protein
MGPIVPTHMGSEECNSCNGVVKTRAEKSEKSFDVLCGNIHEFESPLNKKGEGSRY